jgi:hypothetical protein
MAGGDTTMQERFEWQRQEEWRRAGVSELNIHIALASGMNAEDVGVFRDASGEGFFIVVRCPKRASLPWHGVFAAKPGSMSGQKSGSTGVLVRPADPAKGVGYAAVVSDYDLMSVWREGADGRLVRFPITALNGEKRGPFSPEAKLFVKRLNSRLKSRIQHGCNDDLRRPDNKIDLESRFVGFRRGLPTYLPTVEACDRYYTEAGLKWPYDEKGLLRNEP